MTVPSGRFLMVEMESGVHANRINAFVSHLVGLTGVVSVVDLSAISQATLDTILFQPEPIVAPKLPARTVQMDLVSDA